MRVVCVYREGEDYSRSVAEWLENFRRRTGREIEVLNPDIETVFCENYDIVEYPTILALGEHGEVRERWVGKELPPIDSVMFYML